MILPACCWSCFSEKLQEDIYNLVLLSTDFELAPLFD